MLPPFIHLRALAAVIEEGGVRPASKRLGIAHSAVSRSLGELELATGVAMVRRRGQGRRLELTPEGQTLGNAAIAAIAGIEAALATIARPTGRNGVVINTTSSFAARWLFPRMLASREVLAGVDVSVTVSREVAPPQSQGADLSVRLGAGPWAEAGAMILGNDLLLPVASQGYLRTLGPANNIAAMRLLHDSDPSAQWQTWARLHGPTGMDCSRGPRYDSGEVLLRAAECGEGVALARLSLTRDSLASGLLVAPFGNQSVRLPNSIWLVPNPATARRGPVDRVARWLGTALAVEGVWPVAPDAPCG
ncbi:LysR family transcriptional regulator [Hoeflea halophila]|uniref:LysR family transcriptional regulator n=1 Tax=Hoeflea halophila TaxID=714899 RepID=A0A286IBL4_9HYPH|nr:LysR family transcriptional regulator [Hoeflea halophila]SOE17407.1 LysR family transcriptional regulator [Hoeflea halophila]